MKKRIFSENINDIAYFKIVGNKQRKVLIFLPGLGAFKENYISHLKNFVNDYKTIYCLDLPEQGSKYEWTIGNIGALIKEFIQMIDDESISEIHLAGHSAGANGILSFLIDYNKKIEDKIVEDGFSGINSKYDFFPRKLLETSKVTNIMLYAPINDFNVVFPKKVSEIIQCKSEKIVKGLFNSFVNYPLFVISKMNVNNNFKFAVNKKSGVQYFKLLLKNHQSFFKYVLNYKTIFQLYNSGNEQFNNQLAFVLKDKNICIVYGSLDWLIKPFGKRKESVNKALLIHKKAKIYRLDNLGHLLRNKNSLDINLNCQMLTNSNVITTVKNHLNNGN